MMRMYRYRNGNLRLKLLTGSEKWPPTLHLSKVPSLKLYSETFSEHESAKVSRITYSLTNFQVSSSFDTRLSIRSGPVGSGSVRSVQCMMTETGCWHGVRDNIHSLSGLRAPIVLFILLAADSSSSSPKVVCCSCSCCDQVRKLLPNCYLTAT